MYTRFIIHFEKDQFTTTPSTYGILSIFSLMIGMIIYTLHLPEKYFPKKFDYLGASHQIWHISIILAIYFGYEMAISGFNSTNNNLSCI
jgi:adiponectin receptor